jgi:phosphate starvation-inducible PhoH-like protein
MAKRDSTRNNRRSKAARGEEKTISPKFMEQRQQKINAAPLKPRNPEQKMYLKYLEEGKPVIIVTGYPGTGKSYLGAAFACDKYRKGDIDKIFLVRPATSKSKSLGFFAGTLAEKSAAWLGEVLSVFKERMDKGALEEAIKHEEIEFIPLEVIKGRSLKDCIVLVEEAEDITVEEARKLLTRIGHNCTMILSGDIGQTDLTQESGLRFLRNMAIANPQLEELTGLIDFNRPEDIVRSEACKKWTMAFIQEGIGDYDR